jgi:hypothetical protein
MEHEQKLQQRISREASKLEGKAAEEGRVWQPPGGEAAAPPAQI